MNTRSRANQCRSQKKPARYRGDFLDGFHVDSPPFEQWLIGERERLRALAIHCMMRLVDFHQHARENGRAIVAANPPSWFGSTARRRAPRADEPVSESRPHVIGPKTISAVPRCVATRVGNFYRTTNRCFVSRHPARTPRDRRFIAAASRNGPRPFRSYLAQ